MEKAAIQNVAELHLNPEIASEREYKGISIGVLKTKAELKK